MTPKDTPARPVNMATGWTKVEDAAIRLKVPNSGTPWLDDMIREARKMDAEQAAMLGLIASGPHDCDESGIAHDARLHAASLLRASTKES